ncbi:MAG: hypothetical protein BWY88_00896 [Synergistetes bacterium ADurb.Bin520]|nr:MAG: hypothetical protein BWY88_00896 [Synergistetes bacterium ADurb.Bin520]
MDITTYCLAPRPDCCDGRGGCPNTLSCPGCDEDCGPYNLVCCYENSTVVLYPRCCVTCV